MNGVMTCYHSRLAPLERYLRKPCHPQNQRSSQSVNLSGPGPPPNPPTALSKFASTKPKMDPSRASDAPPPYTNVPDQKRSASTKPKMDPSRTSDAPPPYTNVPDKKGSGRSELSESSNSHHHNYRDLGAGRWNWKERFWSRR